MPKNNYYPFLVAFAIIGAVTAWWNIKAATTTVNITTLSFIFASIVILLVKQTL